MDREDWNQARLIPTSGINGADEQERRATSAVLAVMSSVREFGRVLTQPLGAPAGVLTTFIEVPFVLDKQRQIPDGLIEVTRGGRRWTALVEVKTGTNALVAQQIENYLEIARQNGYDAVITISNEIAPVAGRHPTRIDRRKLRKVALYHWSWSYVLAEAVLQKEHRGVADPDQAWILGELIRYLEHPRSGALEFDDMGPAWVAVRDSVARGTLRANDSGAAEVADRFDALLRFTSLRLGRLTGEDVVPLLSRRDLASPETRTQALVSSLCGGGVLHGAIRIPKAVGALAITADLRAGSVTCHVDVEAPRQGRPATRVRWLVRQLNGAADDLRVEAFVAHGRGSVAAELLRDVRQDPLVLIPDPAKELRSFRVALTRPIGPKRGRGRGSFIDSVTEAVDLFHRAVVRELKTWTPPVVRVVPEPEAMPAVPVVAPEPAAG